MKKKKILESSFERLYNYAEAQSFRDAESRKSDSLYTFSAVDMPLSLFCVNFSDSTGYGIVCSNDLSTQTVDLEIKDATVSEVIEVLSKQLGKDFILRGNTFYIGGIKKGDRSFAVRKVFCMSGSDAQSLAASFLSDYGKSYVTTSGVLVVVDVEPVVQTISSAFDRFETIRQDTFICQLFLVVDSDGWTLNAGAKNKTTGTLSYSLSKGQGGDFDFSDVGNTMEVVFSGGVNDSSILASPLILCTSDTSVKWQDGQSYPIPLKTVSNEGTVTTSNYQYKDTGLSVELKVQDFRKSAQVTCNLVNSSISGWVSDQPILDQSTLNTIFHAEHGAIYLIGSLKQVKKLNTVVDTFTFKGDHSSKEIQVYFRLYRVSPVRALRTRETRLSVRAAGRARPTVTRLRNNRPVSPNSKPVFVAGNPPARFYIHPGRYFKR